MFRKSTPSLSSSFARAGLSATRIRSTMIFEPYRRAARTASRIVASSVTPMTVMTSAPAFAAISTSNAPVSIVLRSATMVFPGNDFLSCRTTSMPSDLTRGVPASSQSAPPSTASFAASNARLRCIWSRATCSTGSIERTYLAVSIKTYLPRRPQSCIYRRPSHRRHEDWDSRQRRGRACIGKRVRRPRPRGEDRLSQPEERGTRRVAAEGGRQGVHGDVRRGGEARRGLAPRGPGDGGRGRDQTRQARELRNQGSDRCHESARLLWRTGAGAVRRLERFPGRANPAAPSEREGREVLQHGLEHADGPPEVRGRRA